MKMKSIYLFGIIVICIVFLLIAGCTNKTEQKNAVPASSDKAASSTVGSINQRAAIEKDYVFATEMKINKDSLTLLDHVNVDMNNDGKEETIELYTAAEKDSKGEIA